MSARRCLCLVICIFLLGLLSLSAQPTGDVLAQDHDTTRVWTVADCIRYAVGHSHGLRQRELQLDNSEASRLQATGAFLPSLGASAGTQWNFGRAIDPETNTYTSVSTFNNGYGLSASLPVFDGFSRLHALRAARADVLMQKNALQADRDQVALDVYQAFVNVVYYQETVRLAREKLHESEMTLRQTEVMEEEGLKSPADVALIRAQVEADRLTLTRQENARESGMLKLKEVMGLTPDPSPVGEGRNCFSRIDSWDISIESFTLDDSSLIHYTPIAHGRGVGGEASLLLQSYYALQSSRHALGVARSAFYPTVYLNAGVNTSYFRNLSASSTTAYGRQLKNNLGEYVSLSLSIPLFSRLGNIAALRRAKNNVRIAEEQYAAKRLELEVLRRQAHLDVKACQQECIQGTAKVAADSLAYELVRQQYREGLASPIDLQTSAATLLQSRGNLLQSRLMVGVKEMMRLYNERLVSRENYLQAEEDYRLAERKQGLISQRLQQDSIYRSVQMDQMEDNLANMRTNVVLVRERKNKLEVRAPIDGELGLLDVELGQSVTSGQKIGQINDLGDYKIEAQVDEHYIDRVKAGLSASFARGDKEFALAVRKVYPEVRQGKFRTDFIFRGSRPENIRSGQTYYINLELGQPEQAILIPRGAFFQTTGGTWIFVLSKDGHTAYRRNIKIGRQNPLYYEVTEGLEAGERVITSGYEAFGDNDRLEIKKD